MIPWQPCDFNGIQELSESKRKLPLNNEMKIVLFFFLILFLNFT